MAFDRRLELQVVQLARIGLQELHDHARDTKAILLTRARLIDIFPPLIYFLKAGYCVLACGCRHIYHAILADKLDTSAFSRQESLTRVIFHAGRITNCDLLHGNETSLNKGVITIRRFDYKCSNRVD